MTTEWKKGDVVAVRHDVQGADDELVYFYDCGEGLVTRETHGAVAPWVSPERLAALAYVAMAAIKHGQRCHSTHPMTQELEDLEEAIARLAAVEASEKR